MVAGGGTTTRTELGEDNIPGLQETPKYPLLALYSL